jgi:hypothetical protein
MDEVMSDLKTNVQRGTSIKWSAANKYTRHAKIQARNYLSVDMKFTN